MTTDPQDTLFILAKYYILYKKLSEDETYAKLNQYMLLLHKNYVPKKWYKSLISIIKRAGGSKKSELESIDITEDEICRIKKLKGILLQKLMFTMLALAKYYNCIFDDSEGWIRIDHSEIFRRANIQKKIEKQCDLLHQLYVKEYIELAEESDNLNINITGFINNDSPIAIQITDLRDLGYVYMQHLGKKYKKCKECGRLYTSRKKNKSLYCIEHRYYRHKKIKIGECVDCGKMFKVEATNNTKIRCDICNEKYRKVRVKMNVKSCRNNQKCNQVLE